MFFDDFEGLAQMTFEEFMASSATAIDLNEGWVEFDHREDRTQDFPPEPEVIEFRVVDMRDGSFAHVRTYENNISRVLYLNEPLTLEQLRGGQVRNL